MINYSTIDNEVKYSTSTTIERVQGGFIVTYTRNDEDGYYEDRVIFSSPVELIAHVIYTAGGGVSAADLPKVAAELQRISEEEKIEAENAEPPFKAKKLTSVH